MYVSHKVFAPVSLIRKDLVEAVLSTRHLWAAGAGGVRAESWSLGRQQNYNFPVYYNEC